MKEVDGSKQRLSAVLTPAQRRQLALTMFEDVLDALHAAPSLGGIVVVTVDPAVIAMAANYGVDIIGDDARAGHTAAVMAAGTALRNAGRRGMLALPGDVPLVTSADIEALIRAHGDADGCTIVPSHDELGSNAVLLSPPDAIPLRFGDNSYYPHLAAAREAGLVPRSIHLPRIALDIDHPLDVENFLTRRSNTRTHRYLLTTGYGSGGSDGSSHDGS